MIQAHEGEENEEDLELLDQRSIAEELFSNLDLPILRPETARFNNAQVAEAVERESEVEEQKVEVEASVILQSIMQNELQIQSKEEDLFNQGLREELEKINESLARIKTLNQRSYKGINPGRLNQSQLTLD